MKLSYAYKDISQLTLGIVGMFCVLSFLLIGGYLYVDYQRYLSTYKITQQRELQSTQDKINSNVHNIKKLSALTTKRIDASNGDTKCIQNILVSTYALLPDRDFLKIQKITYEKFSLPQFLITRLGIVPFKAGKFGRNKPQDCQYALKSLPLIALKIYPPLRDCAVCDYWISNV